MENFIKDNMLIICPDAYKKKILNFLTEQKKLINVKFMTLAEYRKNYLFDYDIDAICYLVKHYQMKVSNAIEIINNLYYVENKRYQSDKLNYLVKIKQELDENGLLIYNPLFKDFLKQYDKIVVGYQELDKFSLRILKDVSVIKENFTPQPIKVFHFKTIEEEVEYFFNEASRLLIKGIDINHLYLMNVNEEYFPYLKRFSLLYHIPVLIPSNDTIIGTVVGSFLANLIEQEPSYESLISELGKYQDNELYSVLVNIINKYVKYPLSDVKELILDDLANTKIPGPKYNNQIRIIDIDHYLVNDDDYVFLLGFNNPLIPTIIKDEDYITDNIKDEVQLDSSIELNTLNKNNLIREINSINNLQISYKDSSPFNSYYPSILLDDLTILEEEYDFNYQYSDAYNKIKYAYLLDDLVKYGIKHQDLSVLYTTYGNINYRTYNNQYQPIDSYNLLNFLNNELTLSYSHIDNYYKCGFKYYLANILKIDLYEETFQTIVGNLFHEVLSKAFKDNFNFDEMYQEIVERYHFSHKETFFINKLQDDLRFIIDTWHDYQHLTGFTKELYEQKINILLSEKPLVNFKGFIDKIMYCQKNGETLVSIIDYKTGNPDINIKNLRFGLSMQLPVYLYLMQNSQLFTNMKFTGFYLEHILNNEIKISPKKSYLEQKKDNLKLVGYSSDNQLRLATFDASYEASEMIKGMKVKADLTLASSSNCLSDLEIDNIIEQVDMKIKEAKDNILMAHFPINPKVKNNENLSCGFCKFRDICYRRDTDIVYLQEGGEQDAGLDEGTGISNL